MLTIALRNLVREWRSGDLAVLLLALTIAVAALTGVGFLVERIDRAVALQANESLAGDLRVGSPQPLSEKYLSEAGRQGLRTARTNGLLSVVFNGEASQLANIRAVSVGYPLRGKMKIANTPFSKGMPTGSIPASTEVWVDSKLLAALGATIGSHLSIGTGTFRVTQVLVSRPDQGGTFADLVPSLVMNEADLASTQLIQPGSRVSYGMLFAGERPAVDRFKSWLQAHKARGERIFDISEVSPQTQKAMDRAGRFLSLASLVSVLLCAIAVAMSARRYVHRHLDSVALLKTLGMTRAFTLGVSFLQLLAVASIAAVLGSAIGYCTHRWLLSLLHGLLVDAELPPPSATPIVVGSVTAIAVLIGFALPPLLQLSRVPALRVLQRNIGPPPLVIGLAFGPAFLAVAALIYWVAQDWLLFLKAIGGLALFVLVVAAAALALVQLAARLRGTVGIAWRYGLANLSRRRMESVVQIVSFGVGFMVLLLLALVRNDLSEDWRRSLPLDLPNHFFINIPPQERSAFLGFLVSHGVKPTRVLPMIRGRLTEINGIALEGKRFADQDGENFATREQNLTWTTELGADNRLTAGRWWTARDFGVPLVSVSTEFQKSLRVKLGDRLTFDVAGERFAATVASIREVKWDSFQPNFFIVFAPGVLEKTVGTYLTSAHLNEIQSRSLVELARKFPSVSIFDIDDLMNQVRSMMHKATVAVQSVFLFTLFAGLTVLLAAAQSSSDERRYESALLRVLGASRKIIVQGVLAEFLALGVVAGALAALGASAAAYFVSTQLLWMPYRVNVWAAVAGLIGSAVLVAFSGWLATRAVVNHPPLNALRQ